MTNQYRYPITTTSHANRIIEPNQDDNDPQTRYYAYIPRRPGSQIPDAESFHCYEQAMLTPSAAVVCPLPSPSILTGNSSGGFVLHQQQQHQQVLRLSPGLPPEQRNHLSLGRPPPAVKNSPQAAFWAGYTPCHHPKLFEEIKGSDGNDGTTFVNPLNSWDSSSSSSREEGGSSNKPSVINTTFTPLFHRSKLPLEIRRPENWLMQGYGRCMVFRYPKDVLDPPFPCYGNRGEEAQGKKRENERDQNHLYLRRDGHVMSWANIAYNWPFLAVGHAARAVYEFGGSSMVEEWYRSNGERGRMEDESVVLSGLYGGGHRGVRIPYHPLIGGTERETGPEGWYVHYFDKEEEEEEEQDGLNTREETETTAPPGTPVVAVGSSSFSTFRGVTSITMTSAISRGLSPSFPPSSPPTNDDTSQAQKGEETRSSILIRAAGKLLNKNKGKKAVTFYSGPPPNTPTEPRGAAPVNAPRGPSAGPAPHYRRSGKEGKKKRSSMP